MGHEKWPGGQTTMNWADVGGLMREFEEENTVFLEFRLRSAGSAERPDLWLELYAFGQDADSTEAVRLGYVKTLASRQRLSTLKALCIYLIYQMDFALGEPGGETDAPA
jgi:hypothetical protein